MKYIFLIQFMMLFYHINMTFSHSSIEQSSFIGIGEIYDAAYSPNDSYIAIVSNNGLYIYENNTYKLKMHIFPDKSMSILKWSSNSKMLFFAYIDNTLINNENASSVDIIMGSRDNYVYDLINNNLYHIDEIITWHYLGLFGIYPENQRDLLPILHNNSINFSNSNNTLIFKNNKDSIQEYNIQTETINNVTINVEGALHAVGYTSEDNIWISSYNINIGLPLPIETFDTRFQIYNMGNNEIINSINYKDSRSRFIDLSKDDKYAILQTDIDSALATNIVNIGNNDGFTLARTRFFNFSAPILLQHRYFYYPLQNEFIVAANVANIGSYFLKYIVESDEYVSLKTLDLASRFSEPYSNDGLSYLVGDYYDRENITFPDKNYDLYKIDYLDDEYEHIFPQSAPILIAFNHANSVNLLTYTNRNTMQISSVDNEDLVPLEITTNKYRQPVTEIWSQDDQTVVNEIFDKPFHEIGAFSPNNQLFASLVEPISATQAQINFYDTDTWETEFELSIDDSNTVNNISFSSDSNQFLTVHELIEIWDTSNGEKMHTLSYHDGSVYHAAFSDDSIHILSSGNDGKVIEYDLETNTATDLIAESSSVIFVSYISNESQVIYTLNDGISKVLDIGSRNVVSVIPAELGDHSFRAVKTSVNEKFLIVGNQIWDIATAELINTIAGHAEPIEDLQVSSDGKWVATRHSDFTARVWSTTDIFQQDSSVNNFNNY